MLIKKYLIAALILSQVPVWADIWRLSDSFDPQKVWQEYGAPERNLSMTGLPLTLGKQTFDRGIGTHAPSKIRISTGGNATLLTGGCGADANRTGTVNFKIVDEKKQLLWASPPTVSPQDGLQRFEIKLENCREIFLIVEDGGNGNSSDHADWVDVSIEYAGDAPRQLSALDTIYAAGMEFIFAPSGFQAIAPAGQTLEYIPQIVCAPAQRFEELPVPPSLRIIQADGSQNVRLDFQEIVQTQLSENEKQFTVSWQDAAYPISVQRNFKTYEAEKCVVVSTEIFNRGTQQVMLLNRDAVLLPLRSTPAWVTSYSGDWGSEMTMVESPMPMGILRHQNSGIAHTTVPEAPFVMVSFDHPLEEEQGLVFAAGLAWSGNWQYTLQRLQDQRLFFSAGALGEEAIYVAPAESYKSPEVVFTWSENGAGEASRNLQRWVRNYGNRQSREIHPIILNSWEGAWCDFTENTLLEMMDGAAELGAEMFVLDDGWFGNRYPRNDVNAGLGDWEVNLQKIPHGLEALAAAARAKGMEFGLWVEPEMVNPQSELFQQHPEWIITLPNRTPIGGRGGQYMLDLSRKEVEDFVYETIAGILQKYPTITYIKWDHNAQNFDAGAAHLGKNQGALSDLHNQAYYRILTKLQKNFPHVMFQLCASGGGRVDFGAFKLHDEFWASDMTSPSKRIFIQWGFSQFFPAETIGSHVSMRHEGDYKFKTDVAMTGRLGIELHPKFLSPEDKAELQKGIAAYKELRPILVASELYRGVSPYDGTTSSLAMVTANRNLAVFFAFCRSDVGAVEKLVIPGLDPTKHYRLREMNVDSQARIQIAEATGEELLNQGLTINWPEKYASVVVLLEAE